MSNILKRLATATIGLHLKSLIFVNISILTLKIIDLLSWHNRYKTVKSYFGKTLLMSWASWARLMNPEGKSTCGEKNTFFPKTENTFLVSSNDILILKMTPWSCSTFGQFHIPRILISGMTLWVFCLYFFLCLQITWFYSRHVKKNLCKLPSLVCHSLRLWARLPHLHLGKWWLP